MYARGRGGSRESKRVPTIVESPAQWAGMRLATPVEHGQGNSGRAPCYRWKTGRPGVRRLKWPRPRLRSSLPLSGSLMAEYVPPRGGPWTTRSRPPTRSDRRGRGTSGLSGSCASTRSAGAARSHVGPGGCLLRASRGPPPRGGRGGTAPPSTLKGHPARPRPRWRRRSPTDGSRTRRHLPAGVRERRVGRALEELEVGAAGLAAVMGRSEMRRATGRWPQRGLTGEAPDRPWSSSIRVATVVSTGLPDQGRMMEGG